MLDKEMKENKMSNIYPAVSKIRTWPIFPSLATKRAVWNPYFDPVPSYICVK